jgi:glyoxylase-like metal-dependent hydrolase (beta-lactamase superfamily II)
MPNGNAVQHYILEPASFKLDGGAMFGIIPKPLWNKVAPADEQNRIDLALRLWLIKTPTKTILVDTGIGDYHGESFDKRFAVTGPQSPLTLALAEIGLAPNDITDLVLSHLHFDHVGGIGEMRDGQLSPVFPNAICHLHKEHYKYAHAPTERDGGSFHVKDFDPILNFYIGKGQMRWLEGSEGDIIDLGPNEKMRFRTSHGHTPWLLHPYSNSYIYLADLIPTSNHVHIPWVMGYDISPGVTTSDKREMLSFVHNKKLTVIFEHDPEYWGAEIGPDPKGNFAPINNKKSADKKAYLL